MAENHTRIMVVAGEASGDKHAAKLVSAIREIDAEKTVEFFGSAGPLMRAAGVEPVVEADGLSIVGIAEIGRALPMFWSAFRRLKFAAAQRRPDAAILVDFPDFNLKLARSLKKQGIRVIYYISPQLWAWRKYRLAAVKKYVDLVITILPFEKDWYANRGFERVEYVGSPLAREVFALRNREEFRRHHGFDATSPLISLLPGSRLKEIVRVLPVMLEAAAVVSARRPETQFLVAASSEQNLRDAALIVAGSAAKGRVKIIANETYDAVAASDAAAVTSGTATLETGILGTPLVIVYKTSELNYRLLEPIINVPHYGLINLIAEKRLAKELIQGDFTAETLGGELLDLITPERNAAMRTELKLAAGKLGQGGASKRAAEAVLRLIGSA
jgi:lipid-A-disaccharide synthase